MISITDQDPAALQDMEETLATVAEAGYNVDASIGTAIRELLIRPAASLTLGMEGELSTFKANLSLATSTDPVMVDALASNFRVTRVSGSKASGSVGLVTAASTFYVPAGTRFTISGVVFILQATYVGYVSDPGYISTATVIYKQMTVLSDGEYVLVVPVTSVDVFGDTIGERTSAVPSPVPTDMIRAYVTSPISGGSWPESDNSLADRALYGITASVFSGQDHITSSFVNKAGVPILSLRVFGSSDEENTRGRGAITGLPCGGAVDVVARTAGALSSVDVLLYGVSESPGSWNIQIPSTEFPGFSTVASLTTSDGLTIISDFTVTYSFKGGSGVSAPKLSTWEQARFSPYQTASITFTNTALIPDASSRLLFTVKLAGMVNLDVLQTFAEAYPQSSGSPDMLVKAPIVCMTSVSVGVSKPRGTSPVDDSAVAHAIAEAVNTLPIGRGLVPGGVIAAAVTTVRSDLQVEFPIRIDGLIIGNSSKIALQSLSGSLVVQAVPEEGVFPTNTCFLCSDADVQVSVTDRVS